jgi:hypothetical protein
MNAFNTLYKVDCNGHTEQKNGLTYLSWAWAWAEVKKAFPASYYTVYESANGWCYHTDGKTCWVKTGVTIVDGDESLEHIEYLPVMDHRNKSIPLDQVTSFDVNKAIQRSLTKAAARHGLGLYIYAGEDLPESDPVMCADCGQEITPTKKSSVSELVQRTQSLYGRPLCSSCATAEYKRNEAKHAGSGIIMLGEPIENNG